MLSRCVPLAVLLLFVLCTTFQRGCGFNLEPRIPIIKSGPASSHFGYSVAQHRSILSDNGNEKQYQSWMLVGAPKGENLQPGTKRSGALFKCPMTTLLSDCEQVQTDGLKNSNGLYKGNENGTIMGPTEDEIKDDQWMGVTLKSQGEGGNILVCGHRYQHQGLGEQNFRWGYGLCYRLTNNFEYKDNYQPCMGKPVHLEHEQFGYCQAGTSGLILEDEVVLGIPGTYTWRGTIHTRNISDDYLYRDKTQYFGVYTDEVSPVDKYSYLGYSVTTGRFFGNKLSYVAGAPRSRGTGQVIFFSRKRVGNPIMNYDLILNGETFASSFGFEVLGMDTNKDAHDDLIVSAPFYFTKKSSGAVYVYLNDGNGISNETPFTRLEGAAGESRFGYSMTSLGDLNLDGYNDLAVGAPYENRGAIYIFLGSKAGIMKEHSQIIRAEDLPGLPYDAFGYALSGGMDLDNNNYNDLLTSAFCSDRVILLRARPIIDIQTKVNSTNLQKIDPTISGCREDPSSPETCFSFNACFKMMSEAGTETFLSLQYNISERFYSDQPTNRIRFRRSEEDKQSSVVVNLRPENMGTFQCSREVVYLREGQRDVLRPVRFKLSYKIHQKDPKPVEEGQPLPDINDYPILNQQKAVTHFEANFAKDCGIDDVCESDLSIVGELNLEKHPKEDYYIFELGKRQFFTLTTSISNNGEPAYIPNLYVSHDKAIDLSLRESETGSYQCSPVESGLLNCNLDNPLVNTTGPLKLVFKPSGLPFVHRYINLTAWVNSTSEERDRSDDWIKFVLEVKRRAEISITGSAEPEQVFYSGEVVGESAIKTLDEIGTVVVHKYLVDNRGPWKLDLLRVLIQWPYQVENNRKEGKWLLYMTDIPTVDGDGECDVAPEFINPLNFRPKSVTVEDEVEIGDNERLRGVTTPSVSITTSKTKKTTSKKVITSSTKKTYTKKTDKKTSTISSSISSSSSGSSVDRDNDLDDYEGSGAYGRGGARTYNRVSRKVYSSGPENKVKADDKYGSYDYEYENYDGFFYGGEDEDKKDSGIDRPDEDRRDENRGSGTEYTQQETHTRRVYTTDSDASESSFRTDSDRLNSVDDIRTVKEGDETYLNGYDRNGDLVWSSRKRLENNLPSRGAESESDRESTVHSRTEVTRRVYSSSDRTGGTTVDEGRGFDTDSRGAHTETISTRREYDFNREEEDNERILTDKMDSIVDFRIIREGDEGWVNGYDRNGQLIWSSRMSHSHSHHGRTSSGRDRTYDNRGFYDRTDTEHRGGSERDGRYGPSVRTDYSYRETTRDHDGDGIGETKRFWSSSVTDKDGTRRRNGSSVTEAKDRRTDNDWDRNESSYNREGYERRTSYSSGGGSRTSYGYDSETSLPDDRERSGSSSVRKDYSYRERTRDEDDDGHPETRRTWSSSVTDDTGARKQSGSSLTDEHGTRLLTGSLRPDDRNDRDGSGYSSIRKEYSHRERTRDEDDDGHQETRRTWSSSVTDDTGARKQSGSSLTDEHGTRLLTGSLRPDDRNDRDGSGYSSIRKEYSHRERTRDEDDDGHQETRRTWSSSVTDDTGARKQSGSSLTDEHGTRLLTGSLRPDDRNDRDGSGYSSIRKEYSHRERTRDEDDDGHQETRRTWSSSVTDDTGARKQSGSSLTDEHGSRLLTGSLRPDDRNDRDGSGYSSIRKEYSYRERTRDEDDDGHQETRRTWSSSVTDDTGARKQSGSSLTDEHGTRLLTGSVPDDRDRTESSYGRDGYERTYSSGGEKGLLNGSTSFSMSSGGHSRFGSSSSKGGEGYRSRTYSSSGGDSYDTRKEHSTYEYTDKGKEPRYRFDWNYPGDRHNAGHRSHDQQNYEMNERTRSDHESRIRWGKSGGFRSKDYSSPDVVHQENNNENDGHRTSSRSYQPQNDEEDLHGHTFSRAVVDRNSDNVDVYSQKVFSRKSGDHWQEVHGPYKNEEWSKDLYNDEKPLKRTKREKEFVIRPEAITDAQTGKTMQIVNFKCDGDVPTAKCFTFVCTIRNLAADQSASISIPSRLWNSTLVEDYPRVSFVSIKSKGKLELPEEIRLDQDQSDDVAYAETLAYSNLLEQLPPEEVPLWVILVSVLAGLLLLVLIAIILWKLGFFKRKRPDPTLSGNIDRDVNGYN